MGTPDFAVPSLKALVHDHDVIAVYSQLPRPSGRGMKTRPSAVHARAEGLGIIVETPERLDQKAQQQLAGYAPDFLIVVAYGLILPQSVLSIPAKAAINGHASLLPRWRGAAPIHRAIAAGDRMTGTTAMLMQKGLDTGPMLIWREEPVLDDDTAASLHDRLAVLTAAVLCDAVAAFDTITPTPQNEADVTWADKITPAEAEIDFTRPAEETERRVRAFAPFPGAWFSVKRDDGTDQRIKVLAATITEDAGTEDAASPGQVLGSRNGAPLIATGKGGLILTRLQPQGKAAMDGAAFLNGNTLPARITRTGAD